jgi:hypothetical protein
MGCRRGWFILLTFTLVFLIASCGVSGDKSPATTTGLSVYCTDMGWCKSYALGVGLTPTSFAKADKLYTVDLYEKGNFRASTTVSWNQLELNVQTHKWAEFPLTKAEGDTYFMHDMSNIFSVKVH